MKTPVVFRPIRWDGPTTPDDERRSPFTFRAGWSSTLDLLDHELTHLDARDVVLELAIGEHELRQDGWPRATARPPFPGIRLAFASKHGPLIYSTDAYTLWQHNVRAVALGLEALRAVDRYGVTHRGEQYTGWAALPAAPTSDAVRAAAETVYGLGGDEHPDTIVDDPATRRIAVRKAARMAHPDRGGTSASWESLRHAAIVLGVPL